MAGIVETFVLLAVVYWLLSRRLHTMVDLMSTRLQQLCLQWQRRQPISGHEPQRLTYASLRRYGFHERHRQRMTMRENVKKTIKRQQFRMKELPWDLELNFKARPFMGLCCSTCTPASRDNYSQPDINNVQNILLVNTRDFKNSLLTRQFCHIAHVNRLKKYDYPYIYTSVLRDERLRDACEVAAEQDMNELGEKNEELFRSFVHKHELRASRILDNMCSTLSDFLLRLTSWVLLKLLPCFLTSVVAHPGQIHMLHTASQSGLPLIFLPLHRSHLDYILITFILMNNNIRSPLVAAGDNLRIPVFGWLLRGLGAFFIKRRIDPVVGKRDVVYRAVLHTYMVECLRAGHNMEFFIEGGRSRTGKTCIPKGGLLSVIVDAYMDGTIEDALLIPVSVNYEKLVDGNFVRELLGQPKQMETFWNAVHAIWTVLNSNYGTMRIDFNQPFSLRELVQSFHLNNKQKPKLQMENINQNSSECLSQYLSQSDSNKNSLALNCNKNLHSAPSSTSLYGTDIVDEEHRLLVENIARHVIFDASKTTAIMSTNAIAFLLLSKFRNGATLSQLVDELDSLRDYLGTENRDVGFSGHSIDIIFNAVEILGPGLVRKDRRMMISEGEIEAKPTIFIEPVIMLPNVIELSYYSNTLLPIFVMESLIATAVCSLLQWESQDSSKQKYVNEEDIRSRSYDLCDILQFEFIFSKPCQSLDTLLSDKIDCLKFKDILSQEEIYYTENQERSRKMAKYLFNEDSSDEECIIKPVQYIVNTDDKSLKHLKFLEGLVRPLLDTYATTAEVLPRLVNRQLPERDFVQEILSEIKSQIDIGHLMYEESLSVDPIKNSLKLFEHWGVLECYTQDRIKLYYLKDTFDSEISVEKVCEKFNKFKWMRR